MSKKITYPQGTVSCATMRAEDLIPEFCFTLEALAKNRTLGNVKMRDRKVHLVLVNEIKQRTDSENYFASESSDYDLQDLFDALDEYSGPYFYFGSHPGDGADYGFWLSDYFEKVFEGLKVSDTSEIPAGYRGEVLHINDHGNCTLYVKSARKLREVWAVV